jgi:hypothetical protein
MNLNIKDPWQKIILIYIKNGKFKFC